MLAVELVENRDQADGSKRFRLGRAHHLVEDARRGMQYNEKPLPGWSVRRAASRRSICQGLKTNYTGIVPSYRSSTPMIEIPPSWSSNCRSRRLGWPKRCIWRPPCRGTCLTKLPTDRRACAASRTASQSHAGRVAPGSRSARAPSGDWRARVGRRSSRALVASTVQTVGSPGAVVPLGRRRALRKVAQLTAEWQLSDSAMRSRETST